MEKFKNLEKIIILLFLPIHLSELFAEQFSINFLVVGGLTREPPELSNVIPCNETPFINHLSLIKLF